MNYKQISVILLCAGESKRMRSAGVRSLLPIKNKSLVHYQIDTIREIWPKSEIVCVLGYEGEKVYREVKNLGVKCVFNEFYCESGSLRSLLLGFRACSHRNIFVAHGDILFNKKNLKFNLDESTVLVHPTPSEDVGVLINNKEVMTFSYGFEHAWQKLIYLDYKCAKLIKEVDSDKEFNKLDFELYNSLINHDIKFNFHISKTVEINTLKDYKLL